MQVYKAYFKVIRKHILSLLIYFGIFFVIAMIINSSVSSQTSESFSETKSSIAVINEDTDSPLSGGLEKYLSKNADIIKINDSKEDIQDALFYSKIIYAVKIPRGFGKSLASGGSPKLDKTAGQESADITSVDLMINRYLDISRLYIKNVPGIGQKEISENVLRDLKTGSSVLYESDTGRTTTMNASYYFQIIAYSILAIMLTGVTTITMSFNQEDISRRNRCAPLSTVKMNLQMISANGTFAIGLWALMCALIFIMYGHFVLNRGTLLLCLNALAFTAASLGIGFLAGKFVRNHTVQAAVTNVTSLGMSFISGVFVSQELLGSAVLSAASFTPAYWYIKAVNDIRSSMGEGTGAMEGIVNSILIQLGFAAAFIIIALLVGKQRKTNTAD